MIIRSCNRALRFFPSVDGWLENVLMQDLTPIFAPIFANIRAGCAARIAGAPWCVRAPASHCA